MAHSRFASATTTAAPSAPTRAPRRMTSGGRAVPVPVAIDAGEDHCVALADDGKVYMWDLQSKALLQTLEGHSDVVLGLDVGWRPAVAGAAQRGRWRTRTQSLCKEDLTLREVWPVRSRWLPACRHASEHAKPNVCNVSGVGYKQYAPLNYRRCLERAWRPAVLPGAVQGAPW